MAFVVAVDRPLTACREGRPQIARRPGACSNCRGGLSEAGGETGALFGLGALLIPLDLDSLRRGNKELKALYQRLGNQLLRRKHANLPLGERRKSRALTKHLLDSHSEEQIRCRPDRRYVIDSGLSARASLGCQAINQRCSGSLFAWLAWRSVHHAG